MRRILDLEHQVTALQHRNAELAAELDATRDALRQALAGRPAAVPTNKLPVLRESLAGQSLVVWRRSR